MVYTHSPPLKMKTSQGQLGLHIWQAKYTSPANKNLSWTSNLSKRAPPPKIKTDNFDFRFGNYSFLTPPPPPRLHPQKMKASPGAIWNSDVGTLLRMGNLTLDVGTIMWCKTIFNPRPIMPRLVNVKH